VKSCPSPSAITSEVCVVLCKAEKDLSQANTGAPLMMSAWAIDTCPQAHAHIKRLTPLGSVDAASDPRHDVKCVSINDDAATYEIF
jgi:hypothetical protein